MDKNKLLIQLINKLGCVGRGIGSMHDFEFHNKKLNRAQVDILLLLGSLDDGVPLKSVASHLNVSPGAISQFVDELSEFGFVERTMSEEDRRVWRLSLSKKISGDWRLFVDKYMESIRSIFEDLNCTELESLNFLLSKLKYKSGVCDLAKGGDVNDK